MTDLAAADHRGAAPPDIGSVPGTRVGARPGPADDALGSVDRHLFARPLVGLLYLAFVFLSLLFDPRDRWLHWLASLVACLLFVPVYVHARRHGTQPWHVAASAALGFALLPLNPGGNTFVIYAVVMLATSADARRTIAIGALLVGLTTLEFFWLMPSLQLALGFSAMLAVIATMAGAGTLYTRMQRERLAQLAASQGEVRRLAARAERERIGRDLHDLLGHTLSVVALKSELAGKLLARDPAAAQAQIAEVEAVARQALAQVREAVSGIRGRALSTELDALRLVLVDAGIALDEALPALPLSPDAEAVLALALREAVTNVLRHADALRVDVELRLDADGAPVLTIADDGHGGARTGGNGLDGIAERLAALGGALDIDSPDGAGTRLTLRLPATALTGPATLPRSAP